MIYVALLRGINVGGKARVEMPRLKTLFKSLGCQDVLTYINSGNVVFRDDRSPVELASLIEADIEKTFGFVVPVVVRDASAIAQIYRDVPQDWTNDTVQKTDVLFLWDEINSPDILNKIAINPQLERVRYCGGALVWNIGRESVTSGGTIKLIKTDLYRHMTVRNINTVRTLYKLMDQLANEI